MALINVSYLSHKLLRTVPMRVVTPADKVVDGAYHNPSGTKFKLLVLLHGYHGSFVDWTNATRIQKWAETHNFVVAMPSGENAFYVDGPIYPNDWSQVIGEELPGVLRRMFPISERREDCYIAGLSMGGYGAIINGLRYHETFSHIVGFSSGVHMFAPGFELPDGELHRAFECLGDLDEAANTYKNPLWAARQLMEAHTSDPEHNHLPRIYMSCGTEDELLEPNRWVQEQLREIGYDVTWYEGPGEHAWTFWGPEMLKVIEEFLPIGEGVEGTDSGHVAGMGAASRS